jgi:hypothetical protein
MIAANVSAPSSINPIMDDPKLQQLLENLDSVHSNQQFQHPRTATTMSAPSSSNPIKDDLKLQQLLKKLDSVNSIKQFQRWRNSFLKEFEAFLDDADKTAKAEHGFADFGANLAKLTNMLKQLQGFLENGDLTADTCTVKARQCLTEVGRQTTVVILQTEALVPGTSAEEKKAGYTKFNVGAALIRDGFIQYGRLLACTEVLEHLRTKTCIEQVADRQILQEMEQYGIKALIFCDVMADLGIYKVMTRCRELGVTEMDNSAGELQPYELENEAPASPRSPKKSPTNPQTPKSSKTPKKAKAKIPNCKEFIVLEMPAPARCGFDTSKKARQARAIGKVGDASLVKERRKEEDQYKPVARVDKNPNSYYHGSDGPSPFLLLNKKKRDEEENTVDSSASSTSSTSSTSSSEDEEPPSKRTAAKSKQKKKQVRKQKEEGKGEERGGGGIDEEQPHEPRARQKTLKPKKGKEQNSEKKEEEVEDEADDDGVPDQSPRPAEKENQPRNIDAKESRKKEANNEMGDEGNPDEFAKPLQKSAHAHEDEDQVDPDVYDEASHEKDNDWDDGAPGESPKQKFDKSKKLLRPSTMRGASFDDDDGGGIPKKPLDPVEKNNKHTKGMRPSTIRGASFADDEGGGVPERLHEPVEKLDKLTKGMRPPTIRGASVGDDGDVPQQSTLMLSSPAKRVEKDVTEMDNSDGELQPYKLENKDPVSPRRSKKSHTDPQTPKSSKTPKKAKIPNLDELTVLDLPSPKGSFDKREKARHARAIGKVDDPNPVNERRKEKDKYKVLVAPAPVTDEKETDKGSNHFKNEVQLAKKADDNARDLERTSNHHKQAGPTTTANCTDVKSRVVQTAPAEKKNAVFLAKRQKCYMWYARMGEPNHADMRRRVADLPESCDINIADVDELPWMAGGKILNIIEMSKLFLGDD